MLRPQRSTQSRSSAASDVYKRQAGMGQRNAQQRRIFECIVQDLLQFFRFVSHILSPFRLVRRGRACPALNLISIALLRAVFFMPRAGHVRPLQGSFPFKRLPLPCLLYTSDAADDLLCVDLGGRRILKKKKR